MAPGGFLGTSSNDMIWSGVRAEWPWPRLSPYPDAGRLRSQAEHFNARINIDNRGLTLTDMKKRPLIQRLRAKKQVKKLAGVVWYADEQAWAEIKGKALDPELFEASYADWLDMANEAIASLEQSHVVVVKCPLLPSEFEAWCTVKDRGNNAPSRAEFVAERMHAESGNRD